MNATGPVMSPFSTPRICPFLTMFMTSYPCKVRHALSIEKKPSPWFDASFDEPVIVFDNVIEVLDLPQFTGVGNGSFRLQFLEGLWIGRVFVNVDHPRGGDLRRSQRFHEEAFGSLGFYSVWD